jgi:hypothetical protein
MKVLFVMSVVCAFLSFLLVGALSAMTIIPKRGAEDLRTRIELLGIGGAIIWGWLAIWARKRRAISQTVALRSIGQALVLLSVIYSLGIVLGFLS